MMRRPGRRWRDGSAVSAAGLCAGLIAMAAAGLACRAGRSGPALRTRSQFVMGTVLEVTLPAAAGREDFEAAFSQARRLDGLLSVFKEDSEVSRLNRLAGRGPVRVSEDLWALLRVSGRVWEESGGAFDPTFAAPAASRGMGKLGLDPGARSVSLPAGSRLDFGGVGKGFALDAAVAALGRRGVRAAFLNFGGQVFALGAPAGSAGWVVDAGGQAVALRDASASTSGESEQPGHILDPSTGRPARAKPPVTVIAPCAAQADAWSTALYVLGPEGRSRFRGCALLGRPDWETPTILGPCAAFLGAGPVSQRTIASLGGKS